MACLRTIGIYRPSGAFDLQRSIPSFGFYICGSAVPSESIEMSNERLLPSSTRYANRIHRTLVRVGVLWTRISLVIIMTTIVFLTRITIGRPSRGSARVVRSNSRGRGFCVICRIVDCRLYRSLRSATSPTDSDGKGLAGLTYDDTTRLPFRPADIADPSIWDSVSVDGAWFLSVCPGGGLIESPYEP
ncbi:hypothetical protein N7527_004847 [Penicillium freii]|nr:hypothetical protein N7527_004847 [Penicillium freii]